MKEVNITHNPYKLETTINIDGQPYHDTDIEALTSGNRLQQWVDTFVPQLMGKLNVSNAVISFKGTRTDCDDFQEVVGIVNENGEYKIKLLTAPGCEPGNKVKEIKMLRDDALNGPVKELQGKNFLEEFETALDPEFEVSVLAPMKAGKSTFINAMIGDDLLPSQTEACTATVTYITNDDNVKNFTGYPVPCNEKASDLEPAVVTPELLKKWNCSKTQEIRITGDIPCIKVKNEVRLVLVDTPGRNNARDENHRRATDDFIKKSDKSMVLYLLNVEQYESEDSKNVLDHVAKAMDESGRQSSDRFLFIITRTDVKDPDKPEEDIRLSINKIRDMLKSHGIIKARLIPTSAKNVLLHRMEKKGRDLTKRQKQDLDAAKDQCLNDERYNYFQHADSTNYVKHCVENIVRQKNSQADRVEWYSGMVGVEAAIEEFIEKYALPMKIYDAYQAIIKQIAKFDINKKLIEQCAKTEEKRKDIHAKVVAAQEKLQRGEKAQEFKALIENKKLSSREASFDPGGELNAQYSGRVDSIWRKIHPDLESQANAQKLVKAEDFHKWVKNLENSVKELHEDFNKALSENINNSLRNEYERLKDHYNQYVVDLLGELSVKEPLVMRVKPEIPSLKDLAEPALRRVVVGTRRIRLSEDKLNRWGKFRNFFSDLGVISPATEEVERKTKFYVVDAIKKTYQDHLHGDIGKAIGIADQVQKDKARAMYESFLEEFRELDEEVAKALGEYGVITASENSIKQEIESINKQQKWLENFTVKLENMVSLDIQEQCGNEETTDLAQGEVVVNVLDVIPVKPAKAATKKVVRTKKAAPPTKKKTLKTKTTGQLKNKKAIKKKTPKQPSKAVKTKHPQKNRSKQALKVKKSK